MSCGYCGAATTPGRDDQVHELPCPFVPERERRIRQQLADLEERLSAVEAALADPPSQGGPR